MVAKKLMTADELADLSPDDGSFELIDGELIEMSPAKGGHLVVVSRINRRLLEFVISNDIAMNIALGEGGYFMGRDPDTVLQPDITIVSDEQFETIWKHKDRFVDDAPLIVIEVKSPSDREPMIARKLAKYLFAGVQEVWWVRPTERQISIHVQDRAPEIISYPEKLAGRSLLPGFELPLTELFD